jgi:acetyl esterase
MCALCDLQTDRIKAVVDPALVSIQQGLAQRGILAGDPLTTPILQARQQNEAYFRAICEPKVDVAKIENLHTKASDGHQVPVKVAVPKDITHGRAMLYMHGGGYAFGDNVTHDHVIRALAASMGMVVFSVDYRRTPEAVFPAALNDSLAALEAVRSLEWTRRFGHDPSRVFALGDSAGAHLAMTLMLALRNSKQPQLAGAALIYGMYARRFETWSHHAYGDGTIGLSSEKMRWFWDQLIPQGSTADTTITDMLDVSLKGLPPLTLFAAECDCLLDDSLDFRENCKRQDHPHSFDLFQGATHGFMHLSSVYSGTRTALEVIAGRLSKFS